MQSAQDLTQILAIRLLGRLDRYVDGMTVLSDAWDDDVYSQVAALMDVMQTEAVSIGIASPWSEFNISHLEILQHLAKCESMDNRIDSMDRFEIHMGRVLDLQAKCLSLGAGKQRLL
jgi:hypothetical protein